jgi:hypothetical protein
MSRRLQKREREREKERERGGEREKEREKKRERKREREREREREKAAARATRVRWAKGGMSEKLSVLHAAVPAAADAHDVSQNTCKGENYSV